MEPVLDPEDICVLSIVYLPPEAAALSWQQQRSAGGTYHFPFPAEAEVSQQELFPSRAAAHASLPSVLLGIFWVRMNRIYCELPTKVMLKLCFTPQMQKAATTASPEIKFQA